jgi:cold shock CspA family protein
VINENRHDHKLLDLEGFAFIRPSGGGQTVFAHFSQFAFDQDDITEDLEVTYEMGVHNGRPVAVNIRPSLAAAGAAFADR